MADGSYLAVVVGCAAGFKGGDRWRAVPACSLQWASVSNTQRDAQGLPIIAVIGDGQLARMMHTEAIELGLAPRVLAGVGLWLRVLGSRG